MKLRWSRGTWNEWFATFDDGNSGWLSEAQGFYCVSRPLDGQADRQADVLPLGAMAPGFKVKLHDQPYVVTDVKRAQCEFSEGELPFRADYEVIGYLERKSPAGDYRWGEHLLFNPYHGFAWLVIADGHWNFLRPIKAGLGRPTKGAVELEDRTFKHFLSDAPRVVSVVGEFYWEVTVGDQAKTQDYICPPYLLSAEVADGEVSWSAGEYLYPAEVARAFRLNERLPKPIGIAMNQPNRWYSRLRLTAIISSISIVAAVILHSRLTPSHAVNVHRQSFEYVPLVSSTDTSQPLALSDVPVPSVARSSNEFHVKGSTTNLAVDLTAPVSNNWLDVDFVLTNISTGETQEATSEVAYYSGYDSDGAWTEGSTTDRRYFTDVQAGRYILTMEPSGGHGLPSTPFSISVWQGVGFASNLALAIVALAFVPLWCALLGWSFENKRWAQSDE